MTLDMSKGSSLGYVWLYQFGCISESDWPRAMQNLVYTFACL